MDKQINFGLLRTVQPIAMRELEQMHTGTLLTRLKKLRGLQQDPKSSDWSDAEVETTQHLIAFKNTEIWRSAWADVKHLLAQREHINRDSKEQYQQSAKAKKNR